MAEVQNEKIVAKIKKLLAVANGNAEGGDHERDTAMKMALKMLAKHNLEMGDVSVVAKELRGQQECWHDMCPWRRTVAGAMARMFFCEFYYIPVKDTRQKYKFVFVGLESNTITAMEMTNYVIKSVGKEAKKARTAQMQTSKFETAFMNAAAIRVSHRTFEMQREAEKEQAAEATGTALVLANYYETEKQENQAFIADTIGTLKVVKSNLKNHDMAGTLAGDTYGKNISLNNQLK